MHGPAHRLALAKPPAAARRPRVARHHGTELSDDFAWLRADNWQDVMRDPAVLDPEIRAYLEAENAYMETQLADTRPLQEELFAEMKARLKQDDSSVPAPDGPFDYYSTFVAGGQYPRLCRRPRRRAAKGGGAETVLLDGNAEAKGKPYWDLGATSHSPDHKLLAYAIDDKGSELFTIRIRDLETGQDLPETIPDTRGEIVWANDGRTLFYIRVDEHQRPLLVYRHVVGTPASADELVYAEKDAGYYVALNKTQSSRFILIDAHDHQSNEIYLIEADAPLTAMRQVAPREHGHEYQVEHHGRTSDHHHELGRRRGLPHLRSPGRGTRPRELARDRAAQARPPDHRYGRLQQPHGTPRARGQPAAHHHPQPRGRRRARHRVR